MDEDRLIEAVLRNRANRIILKRLLELGLADAWLVSGHRTLIAALHMPIMLNLISGALFFASSSAS
jgi:hypothetical protein